MYRKGVEIVDIQEIKKRADDKSSKKKYKEYHYDLFEKFLRYSGVEGKDVVVLGCSTGLDCQLFVLAGAKTVLGVDLDPGIGSDYLAPNVAYLRESISNLSSIANDSFDVVYSVAVFEHVFDIQGALNECRRILRPGGLAYILSAPLWNSPFGHHYKSLMENYPWIHLVLGESEAEIFLDRNGVKDCGNGSVREALQYIYHPQHFNRYPAAYYELAANSVENIAILHNKAGRQPIESFGNLEFFNKAVERGFSKDELLSNMHLLVFRKKFRSKAVNAIRSVAWAVRPIARSLKRKL